MFCCRVHEKREKRDSSSTKKDIRRDGPQLSLHCVPEDTRGVDHNTTQRGFGYWIFVVSRPLVGS